MKKKYVNMCVRCGKALPAPFVIHDIRYCEGCLQGMLHEEKHKQNASEKMRVEFKRLADVARLKALEIAQAEKLHCIQVHGNGSGGLRALLCCLFGHKLVREVFIEGQVLPCKMKWCLRCGKEI